MIRFHWIIESHPSNVRYQIYSNHITDVFDCTAGVRTKRKAKKQQIAVSKVRTCADYSICLFDLRQTP